MSGGTRKRHTKWRQTLFDVQLGLCYYCQKPMEFVRKKNGQPSRIFPTFEHLIRKVDGGQFNSTNIVLAHYKCNIEANRIAQNSKKIIIDISLKRD